jgi:hypothetical protein
MVSAEEIAGLLRKYDEVVRLRRAAPDVPEAETRRAMRKLAAEFPGSLREADELPMEELEQRVRELGAALRDEARVAEWMATMARFHALARGALCAKRWLAGRKRVDDAVRRAFEADATGLRYPSEALAWAEDLARLAEPPRGRVTELVFLRMALELDVDARELRRAVFGEGRRGR